MKVTKEMLKTKAKYFKSGARMAVVSTQMDLLGITDVSTPRQEKNGTVVWKLPIKCGIDKFIEVASFATGYVRNQNGGYTNYQLNKRCDSEPQYYKLSNGYYNKYTTRSCVLIPNEIDRLEYLIAYCLKNYYIKHANFVAEGKYVTKWEHEWKLERQATNSFSNAHGRVKELEEDLINMTTARDYYKNSYDDLEVSSNRAKELESDVHNLENKLATIERIASDRNKWDKE